MSQEDDYRKKMKSLSDYLKLKAKIVERTRNSPDEQNLSAYAQLIQQIVGRVSIIAKAPREKAGQLEKEMANVFLEGISLDSEPVDYFAMITDICCKTCKTLPTSSNGMDIRYEVVCNSLVFFQNLTYFSPKFSQRVVGSEKLMTTLLDFIDCFAGDHVKGTLTDPNVELLSSACAVVYNVVRLSDSDNIMRVRQFGFIEAVRPLLRSNHVGLKDVVVLIMVFAASEEEAKKCCSDEPTIRYLVETLENAFHSKNKRYKGYSNIELLKAIQKLAVIDENKKLLGKCGCLELMKTLFEKGEDEELPYALHITAQLAFNEENAKWIDKELQKLLGSKFFSSEKLRDPATTLKWNVEEKTGKSHTAGASSVPKVPSEQQHIMISYQHDSQPIVRKLVYRLQKEKLKVWVDFNDMKGDMMVAMASAVENASVVLVCMSLKYKDSEFCKMEAQYASKRKKRIIPLKMENWQEDGWLGLLIGQKMYYDFRKSADFETTIGELLRSLHDDTPDGGPAIPAPSPPPSEDFSTWDKSQVQDWCRRNCIPGGKCTNLTGSQLKSLKTRKDQAPDIYLRMIDEFKFSLEEVAHFDSALDAL